MIPIDQTIFEDGQGNCFAAAVASILELPLSDLPTLNNSNQVPDLNRWFQVDYKSARLQFAWVPWNTYIGSAPGFFLALGKSPRFPDKYHSIVVNAAGTMVHDPHPSRAGIIEPEHLGIFIATMTQGS